MTLSLENAKQVNLNTVDASLLLAPLPRDAKTMFHQDKMNELWSLRPKYMTGEKGKVLRATLEGKHLENDVSTLLSTVDFLFTLTNRSEQGVEQLTQELYQNRATVFPLALQQLEHFGPSDVSASHAERNPLLHTCYVIAEYVVDIATAPEVARPSDDTIRLELFSLVIHDFGKLFNSFDPSHPSGSVVWGEQWIAQFVESMPSELGQKEVLKYKLRFLTRFHDLPGNIDLGNVSLEEAIISMLDEGYVPSTSLLLGLERIQTADMKGTPLMPERFREKNNQIIRQIMQAFENIKEEYGLADSIVPTEESILSDKALINDFFALVARAEVVSM